MNPDISIIVPCYNQAVYLSECLQSVLDQSYTNWECVIVNDGSPDNTQEVVLQWTTKDSRFIYFEKDNGGLSNARNFGISNARGRYILPLDCDDKIGKKYVELGVKKIKENENIGVVYCKGRYFDAINRPWILQNYNKKQILCENLIFCSAIFRKDDWKAIGGYDENMRFGWEDWEFWINLIYSQNREVEILNYEGFYYRQKENSMLVSIAADEEKQNKSYNYIYAKHKKLYDENFTHPIIAYKRVIELENRNKLLLLVLKKFRSLFGRK